MALLTAIVLAVLSLGVLFARPDEGVVSLVAAADPGAAMVRRLIPPAFIVPIGLGALWLLARDANWVSREGAVSAFVGAVVITFLTLVMRAAVVVRNADLQRDEMILRAESARSAAERAADRTNRLRRTAEALSSALTPIAVARVIVSEGLPALSATASEVAVLTADGNALDLMAVSGLPSDVADAWRRFPVTSRVPLADAVRTTEPVLLDSPEEIAHRYPDLAPVLERVNVRAMIVTPMVVDGRPLGSLSFSFSGPRAFDESDVTFTRALGQQCAQALERARLFAAEQSARADAEAANRAKTEFLAMMSHELRTPLNAIAGYAELMELGISGPVSDTQRDQLGRIRRSQRHLLGIIEDLLDLSRLEHGKPADIELGSGADPRHVRQPRAAHRAAAQGAEPGVHLQPGRGRPHRVREPGAYRADRAQPALERHQVHGAGRTRRAVVWAPRRARGDSRERHRPRDPAGEAGFDLRAVHAAGDGPHADDGGDRAWSRDQPATCPGDDG